MIEYLITNTGYTRTFDKYVVICESVLNNFTQRYSLFEHAVTDSQLLRAQVDYSYSESDSRPDITDLHFSLISLRSMINVATLVLNFRRSVVTTHTPLELADELILEIDNPIKQSQSEC